MCVVCVMWNRLTPKEIDKALAELVTYETTEEESAHYQELLIRLEREGKFA